MIKLYMLLIIAQGWSGDSGMTSQQLGPYPSLATCQEALKWVQSEHSFTTMLRCVPVPSTMKEYKK